MKKSGVDENGYFIIELDDTYGYLRVVLYNKVLFFDYSEYGDETYNMTIICSYDKPKIDLPSFNDYEEK